MNILNIIFPQLLAANGHIKLTDFGLSEIDHKITLAEILPTPRVSQTQAKHFTFDNISPITKQNNELATSDNKNQQRTPGQILSLTSNIDFNDCENSSTISPEVVRRGRINAASWYQIEAHNQSLVSIKHNESKFNQNRMKDDDDSVFFEVDNDTKQDTDASVSKPKLKRNNGKLNLVHSKITPLKWSKSSSSSSFMGISKHSKAIGKPMGMTRKRTIRKSISMLDVSQSPGSNQLLQLSYLSSLDNCSPKTGITNIFETVKLADDNNLAKLSKYSTAQNLKLPYHNKRISLSPIRKYGKENLTLSSPAVRRVHSNTVSILINHDDNKLDKC